MRKIVGFALAIILACFPVKSYAQNSNFQNHLDFLWVGEDSGQNGRFGGLIAGYHFTFLEIGRVNLGGPGIGLMMVHDRELARTSDEARYDTSKNGSWTNMKYGLGLTAPMSVSIYDNKKGGALYFNMSYVYNMSTKSHAALFGFSISPTTLR